MGTAFPELVSIVMEPSPTRVISQNVDHHASFEVAVWDAGATILRTATLALVHSIAAYCSPVWCRSDHTCLIDPAINDTLLIAIGCLRSTPADNLPILAGIQPAELRRKGATQCLALRAVELGNLFHSAVAYPPSGNTRHLKSRHPFVPAAQLLGSSDVQGLREGVQNVHCTRAREDETKHSQFFCNQDQNY